MPAELGDALEDRLASTGGRGGDPGLEDRMAVHNPTRAGVEGRPVGQVPSSR